MDINEFLETAIGYMKAGSEKSYDYLSKESKKEVEKYSKDEVVKGLQNFFRDLLVPIVYDADESIRERVLIFSKTKPSIQYEVKVVRESLQWKLVWSEVEHLKNI